MQGARKLGCLDLRPMENQDWKREGTAYKDMSPRGTIIFILKLAVCIMTFGMAFPNIMSD